MRYFLLRSDRVSSAPTSFLLSISPPGLPACHHASSDTVQTCCPASGLWKQSCVSWKEPCGGLHLLPLGASSSSGPPACFAAAFNTWHPSPCTAASAAAPWPDQSWMYFHHIHEPNSNVSKPQPLLTFLPTVTASIIFIFFLMTVSQSGYKSPSCASDAKKKH